ncbi:hypothetical protein KP509_24G025900 [Ceratopteris richardii]|nr:hypothetical protein KP509_24G025900 [Ceratopteris richardii]
MRKSGIQVYSCLGNYLVSVLVTVGDVDGAVEVFDALTFRSPTSWNSLIFGLVQCGKLRNALHIFQQMQENCVYVSESSILTLLKACIHLKAETIGIALHAEVARRGLEGHLLVGSSLVDMYAKCDFMTQAQETFDKLPGRDIVTWNVLIVGYSRLGHWEEVLLCFGRMQSDGCIPSIATLVFGLKACAAIGNSDRGGELHAEIARLQLTGDPQIGSALVDMYSSCGLLECAEEVLDNLPIKHLSSYNALLGGYVKQELNSEALLCFKQMQLQGIVPNVITYTCTLKAAGTVGDLDTGLELYCQIARMGFQNDLSIGSALIDMFVNCGWLSSAEEVLLMLEDRNVICWNALISGYAKHGFGTKALKTMEQMQEDSLSPSKVTYASILKACADMNAIHQGRVLHMQITKKEMELDLFVGSSLVNMYADAGLLEEAQNIFDRLPMHNIVAWTALVGGYAKHGFDSEALEYFEEMQLEGVFPNAATYACSLKACGSLETIEKGFHIHVEIARRGLESDILVGNALIDMYAKCGLLKKASDVFHRLPTRDTISWNALISGYSQEGLAEEALSLFERMQTEQIPPDAITFSCILNACGGARARNKGKEIHHEIDRMGLLQGDVIVGNALIDMYVNCGSVSKAQEVFDKLPIRDVVTWTTLIAGYVNHERHEEALQYHERMEQSGVFSNAVTFVSILKACGSMGLMGKGQRLHTEIMRKDLLESDLVGNSLVDLYAKCGLLLVAHEVFQHLVVQDEVSWNTLIAGHAHLGVSKLVFRLFDQMLNNGEEPTTSTFLSVLNACSHAGIVEDGLSVFESMSGNYDLTQNIEHFNCMADMFARSGQLEKSCIVIREMPFHPNPIVWHTLMNACQTWGNRELGWEAFEQAVQIDDKDAGAFVFVMKMFLDVSLHRETMKIHSER